MAALRRLADLSNAAHNGNAFFRALTGVALIAAAAALYTNLKDRSPMLSAMAAFGDCCRRRAGADRRRAAAIFVELGAGVRGIEWRAPGAGAGHGARLSRWRPIIRSARRSSRWW